MLWLGSTSTLPSIHASPYLLTSPRLDPLFAPGWLLSWSIPLRPLPGSVPGSPLYKSVFIDTLPNCIHALCRFFLLWNVLPASFPRSAKHKPRHGGKGRDVPAIRSMLGEAT